MTFPFISCSSLTPAPRSASLSQHRRRSILRPPAAPPAAAAAPTVPASRAGTPPPQPGPASKAQSEAGSGLGLATFLSGTFSLLFTEQQVSAVPK